VHELLEDARRWPEREYLVHGTRRITYAVHEERVRRFARTLLDAGAEPGETVVIAAGNSADWVVALWAIWWLGAVAVLANAWWSEKELGEALGVVEARVVVADRRRRALLPPSVTAVPVEGAGVHGAHTAPVDRPSPPVDEHAPAVVIFTSGTTGAAKGATLSHRAVIANLHNLLLLTRRLPGSEGSGRGAVTLLTVPVFHMGGLQNICLGLLTGGTLVFPTSTKFEPGEVLELIERERVVSWGSVPTMVGRVVDHPDLSRRDVSSLTSLTIGGAPVPPELAARARVAFGSAERGVGTIYGLTESGGTLTAGSGRDLRERPGTVGRPLPVVELKLVGAGDDGVGEVHARTPTVMSGYWGDAASIVDADGWIHSGDLGVVDDDGYLYIVDRSKDIVIRGGENVAGAHVEARLLEHPDVAEAAVVGLAHADLGEEVAAIVVPRPGARLDEASLRTHAAATLSYFEVPTRWWIRGEPLPTNAVGKVLKRELRDGFDDARLTRGS
jgi:long-chain acyl-CoA synthetase